MAPDELGPRAVPGDPFLHYGLAELCGRRGDSGAVAAHEWLLSASGTTWKPGELEDELRGRPFRTQHPNPPPGVCRHAGLDTARRSAVRGRAVPGGGCEIWCPTLGGSPSDSPRAGATVSRSWEVWRSRALESFQTADTIYGGAQHVSDRADHLRTLLQLGQVYGENDQFDESLEAFGRAAERAETNMYKLAEVFGRRASIELSAKRYVDAVATCREALRLVPTYVYARTMLCQIYMQMNEYKQVIREATEIIQAQSRYTTEKAEPREFLGDAYWNVGRMCDDQDERSAWMGKAADSYGEAAELLTSPDMVSRKAYLLRRCAEAGIEQDVSVRPCPQPNRQSLLETRSRPLTQTTARLARPARRRETSQEHDEHISRRSRSVHDSRKIATMMPCGRTIG